MSARSDVAFVEPAVRSQEATVVLQPVRDASSLQSLVLTPGKYTIGTADECTLRLNGYGVQPVHCLLLVTGTKTIVKAWDRNTWLNEGRIHEAELVPGDRLGVGPIEYRVHMVGDVRESDPRREQHGSVSTPNPDRCPPESGPFGLATSPSPPTPQQTSLPAVRRTPDDSGILRRLAEIPMEDHGGGLRSQSRPDTSAADSIPQTQTSSADVLASVESIQAELQRHLTALKKEFGEQPQRLAELLERQSAAMGETVRQQCLAQEAEQRMTLLGHKERHLGDLSALLQSHAEVLHQQERNLLEQRRQQRESLYRQQNVQNVETAFLRQRQEALDRERSSLAADKTEWRHEQRLLQQECFEAKQTHAQRNREFEPRSVEFDEWHAELRQRAEALHQFRNTLRKQQKSLQQQIRERQKHQQRQQKDVQCQKERLAERERQLQRREAELEAGWERLSQARRNLSRRRKPDTAAEERMRETNETQQRRQQELDAWEFELSRREDQFVRLQAEVEASRIDLQTRAEEIDSRRRRLEESERMLQDETGRQIEQTTSAQATNQSLNDAKAELERRLRELTARQDEIDEARKALQVDQQEHRRQASRVSDERTRLQKQEATLTRERNDLEANRREFESQRAELTRQRQQLEEERKALRAQRDAWAEGDASLGSPNEHRPPSSGTAKSEEGAGRPNPLRSALSEVFELPDDAVTRHSAPATGSAPLPIPAASDDREEAERVPTAGSAAGTQTVELTRLLDSLSAPEPGSKPETNDRSDSYPETDHSSTQTHGPEDSTLDDAEDADSVAAYMERLLARTRRNVQGPPGRTGGVSSHAGTRHVAGKQAVGAAPSVHERPENQPSFQTGVWNASAEPGSDPPDPHGRRKVQPPAESPHPDVFPPAHSGPCHPVDKEAVRADLNSFRKVANLSTRSAVAKHTWKRLRVMIMMKCLLAVVAFGIAAALLTGTVSVAPSLQAFGWSAAAIGGITALELLQSLVTVSRLHSASMTTALARRDRPASDTETDDPA